MLRICLLTGFLCIFLNNPAHAEFGDCMDSSYLGGFGGPDHAADPLSPVRSLTCLVEFEFVFPSPGGARRIRGIRDAGADWAFAPGAMAEVERGARAAAAAMPQLGGDWRIDDVTILMLDDGYDRIPVPPDPDGTVAAVTSGETAADECKITTFLLGRGGELREIAYSVAHEIFHCVQAASLSAAQWETTTRGGVWWAEGSAEYFAGLAFPDAGDLNNRAGRFDAAVEAGTPLHDQDYGMSVFFHWLDGRGGAGAIMGFLRRMAASSDDAAQRAAMRSALPAADWLVFAEDYVDGTITMAGGAPFAFANADGELINFANNRTERMTLEPFVIRRGWISYDCGRWRNGVRASSPNLGARREEERAWGSYPPEVDATEGDEQRYRFAALRVEEGAMSLTIRVERIHSCQPCAGSRELDACIVGTWVMSGGGPIEWMKRMGVPIIRGVPGTRIVRFDDDGVYFTQAVPTQITVQLDDKTAEGVGAALPAAGRWSISDGRLAICQDSGGMSGTVMMDGVTMPVAQTGGGTLINGYSCSETSLQTILDIGAGSPMSTTYDKIAGPSGEE